MRGVVYLCYMKGKKLHVLYSRVSTVEQTGATQLQEGRKFDKVYFDKVSGKIALAERNAGSRLLKDIEDGKIASVTVTALDRLDRNLKHTLITIDYFIEKGVQLHAKGLPSLLNDDGSENDFTKLIIQIMGAIAEMERKRILARTNEGREIAKSEGRFKGRAKGTTQSNEKILANWVHLIPAIKLELSTYRIAKDNNISRATVDRVKKAYKESSKQVTLDEAIKEAENSPI